MIINGINLGVDVDIHETTSINNVRIGDRVKISKRCSIFGSKDCPVVIGNDTYVGMHTIINGFTAGVKIGSSCSIAQNVNIMSDSGPNASKAMQRIFPLESRTVTLGDHTWIGASAILLPGAVLGNYCVVGAGSMVKSSFEDYSIVGGTPAILIRRLTSEEIEKIRGDGK